MIDESGPWREELWRVARRLEGRKLQQRWTSRSNFLVERDVMVSAYAIRRLADAYKLSDQMRARTVPVEQYKLIGRAPDLMSRDRLNAFYDLTSGTSQSLGVVQICNQFVHSFVWVIETETGSNVTAIFFCSDRARSRWLYRVTIDDLVSLLDEVAEDDVVALEMIRGEDGQFNVVRASNYHEDSTAE